VGDAAGYSKVLAAQAGSAPAEAKAPPNVSGLTQLLAKVDESRFVLDLQRGLRVHERLAHG
jgi:hypothetical protein